MAFGTFDVLHPGHLSFLQAAKKLGDRLVVVVGRDVTVLKVKKLPPKFSENIRLKDVQEAGIADDVRLGHIGDKFRVIREVAPEIIALGYDQVIFTDELEKQFGDKIKIVRLSAFKPEIYKSSKLRIS